MMPAVTDASGPGLVLRAVSFATRSHRGQTRKDGVTPYAAHPMRVLFILSHLFGVRDPETLAAGVLHDTIEDTPTDYDRLAGEFGTRVAGWVATLSKDKRLPEEPREQAFFDSLAAAPLEVKLCKLADSLDNLLDAAGLPAGGAGKARAKALKLVEAFDGRLPREWAHPLEALRREASA
jgi:guanosine-3',5'-bis(diphosphate) 3'-pyrophosphohydrolase